MAEREIQRTPNIKPILFQVNRSSKTQSVESRLDGTISEVNRVLALLSTELNKIRDRITKLEEGK